MNDKFFPPLGAQIRTLRKARGWTLANLARRAGTSAPSLHRYESGWDRFEVATLRRIAAALGARLEIRLIAPRRPAGTTPARFLELLAPLFWDKDLTSSDLREHPQWVLRRVLLFGNRDQVTAARLHFGDEAIRKAIRHREVDARTRSYWRLLLNAPEGT